MKIFSRVVLKQKTAQFSGFFILAFLAIHIAIQMGFETNSLCDDRSKKVVPICVATITQTPEIGDFVRVELEPRALHPNFSLFHVFTGRWVGTETVFTGAQLHRIEIRFNGTIQQILVSAKIVKLLKTDAMETITAYPTALGNFQEFLDAFNPSSP